MAVSAQAGGQALIIYHADCTDGACAAWATAHHCKRAGLIPILVPAYPMTTPEDEMPKGEERPAIVFVVDVCLPLEALRTLDSLTPHGCWVLDHHKTNVNDIAGYERAIFDMDRSGAGLAWDETQAILYSAGFGIVPGTPRPWFVDYVEDYDLWRFKLQSSREINASICISPREPDAFVNLDALTQRFGTGSLRQMYAENGAVVLDTQRDAIARATRHPLHGSLFDVHFVHVASPVYQSEIAEALITAESMPACVWYVRADEKRGPVVQVSLRSKDGLEDVSEIARKLGGGGHRNSAGAVVPLVEWAERLGHWAGAPIHTPPKPREMEAARLVEFVGYVAHMLNTRDSAEGRIEWTYTDKPDVFEVTAAVRCGTSEGQGGMLLIEGDK